MPVRNIQTMQAQAAERGITIPPPKIEAIESLRPMLGDKITNAALTKLYMEYVPSQTVEPKTDWAELYLSNSANAEAITQLRKAAETVRNHLAAFVDANPKAKLSIDVDIGAKGDEPVVDMQNRNRTRTQRDRSYDDLAEMLQEHFTDNELDATLYYNAKGVQREIRLKFNQGATEINPTGTKVSVDGGSWADIGSMAQKVRESIGSSVNNWEVVKVPLGNGKMQSIKAFYDLDDVSEDAAAS